MTALGMDREDIKAAIRKRHGSLAAFERTKGLPPRSITDVLRGKASRHTAEVIAAEIGHQVESLFPSANADSSAAKANAHRQNAEAR